MFPLAAFELYRFFHDGDEETMALKGVDLTLERGEFVALMGPSGSGKSTLLSCLAGLDEPDGGYVEVMANRLSRRPEAVRAKLRARHIGMLMQSGNLVEHLTVAGNIRLQHSLAGIRSDRPDDEILEILGISGRRNALPSQLSGGEAARAGLAVALSAQPAILICDEPTAEVDAATELDVLAELHRRQQAGTTILVATHSRVLAEQADRIVHITDGRLS
ncbi:MAG TPA: ABC transporter ATP-binding protein [Arsenicitalea sp.]|jgi:putative ABC transport system ATP-binding protein|nr:ABC transporter ATP-binding protein [Arsenicitalea sp.]